MSKQSDYFKTFCTVSRAFGTTLNKQDILDLIVKSAIDTMDGKAACLFLEDKNSTSDVFVPIAQKGLSRNYLHAEPKEAKRAVAEIMKKGYIAIHDATADPKAQNREAKKKEGIASILVVPVIVKDRAIGVLTLYTSTKRTFTNDEIDFLRALAEHGGMAIERARLIDQITRNTQIFNNLALRINDSLDIQTIMGHLSKDVAKAMGVKAVTVRLLDKNKQSLELVGSFGLSKKYLTKGPVRIEKSVTEAINGRTVVITDALANSEVQYRKEKKEEGIASILSVPIKAKDEVIGVMRFYTAEPTEFSQADIQLAQAVASLGGLSIQNSSMYLMLKEDMRCLKEDMWCHKSWF